MFDAKSVAFQLSRKLGPSNPKVVLSGIAMPTDGALEDLVREMQEVNRCPVHPYAGPATMRAVLEANSGCRYVIFLVGAGMNAQSRSELKALPSNGLKLKVVLVQFA
jgi:hypothetical protein